MIVLTYFFVGPDESELHSSKKGPVICQDEKPSPSEKRHLKGILKSKVHSIQDQ